MAVVVIPFTLSSVLLCRNTTCERAMGARRRPPGNPGSRQENRRFAIPSAYSFMLSGRAPACIHAGYALSARPCASPRHYGNASAIYSRTRVSL